LTTEEAEAIASATRSIGRAIASKDQEKLKSLLIRRQKLSNQAKFRLTAVEPVLSLLKLTRGLLFVDTIETCDELAGRLNSAGYRVRPYHSKLTAVTRSANLQLYHSGQLDMLVTCAALDEGFDAPSTQFVFLVASTRSDRRRIQRIGRALRPAPGKSLATAVSFYATDFEQAALAEAEEKLGADATKWMEAKIS
jgi:superfamily II DNA or RNA helicase